MVYTSRLLNYAQVAELADALASGASDRKVMGVRVSPWAFKIERAGWPQGLRVPPILSPRSGVTKSRVLDVKTKSKIWITSGKSHPRHGYN